VSVDRKRPFGLTRTLLAALMVSLVALGSTSPVASAVPGNFWGVSPQGVPTFEEFQRLRAGGVDSVRIPVGWSAVQKERGGAADFSSVDPLVAGAAQAGLEVLPFVYNSPSWVVPLAVVPGSHGTVRAPKTLPVRSGFQRSSWTGFLKLVVARYGPNGSFWVENPALPKRPIRTWQIWNEENFKYFVVRPNPAEYGKLVKLSHAAIKSVDPGAKIVLGGMFAQPREAQFKGKPPQAYFATDFLEQLYRTTPGIKSKFDGVALHPYTGAYQELTPDVEAFRAVLKENNDAGKGLWITEIGWSSQPPDPKHNAFAKGRQGQVKQLNGAFRLFKGKQAKWRLKQIFWFSVDDQAGICNFCDGTGLFGDGFVPKPAWFAYVKFAGGNPG
jgi:hypothetical protein